MSRRAWQDMITHPFNRAEVKAAGCYLVVLMVISLLVAAVNLEWLR